MQKAWLIVILLGLSWHAHPQTISTVSAQDNELPSVMVNPDHPLYWLKRGLYDPPVLFFAFSPKSKAETHLDLASVRVAELRNMVEKGMSDAVDDLVHDRGSHIDEAMRDADRIDDQQVKANVWAHVANMTEAPRRSQSASGKGAPGRAKGPHERHPEIAARPRHSCFTSQGLPKPCPRQNPNCTP